MPSDERGIQKISLHIYVKSSKTDEFEIRGTMTIKELYK